MKKALVICLIVLFYANTALAVEKEQYELVDIADFMLENNLAIKEWQVTLKEHLEVERLEALIQELSTSHSITKQENENSTIYLATNTQKKHDINVNYSVIFPKDKHYKSELVITINGTSWNEEMESSYMQLLSVLTKKYFTDDIKIFSCMTTMADDIMENGYIADFFIEKFNLQHVKEQYDTIKSTKNAEYIYGYTSFWGRKITIQDTPVNVQIVTEILGNGDVQYTIGTPILINEY
ncbi:YwmB family TATA-box binding protein [Ornithinibacillus sp. JPR2-1]|uniref:YwmB family TATA-box binding protein n=1 Tax=Ornithinibacillus sp. JPR2-1 TaxID=2094019 RepID=UPI0031DADF3F